MTTDPFEPLRGRARPAPTPAGDVEAAIVMGRRRRRLALVGGGAGTTLVAGVLALALMSGEGAPQTLDLVDSPSATAAASEEPSYAPSPSPSAAASPTGEPTPDASPSPAPDGGQPQPPDASSPPAGPFEDTHDDGREGWGSGFSGCSPAAIPQQEGELPAGLTVRTSLAATTFRPDETIHARIIVTNTSDTAVEFGATDHLNAGTLLDASGQARSASYWTDAIGHRVLTLEPGGSWSFTASVETHRCGDGPAESEPLPAGDYSLLTYLSWSGAGGTSQRGRWVSPLATVRLHPAAPTTMTYQHLEREPWRPGTECELSPGALTSSVPGYALDVALDRTTVSPGEPFRGTAVLRRTGEPAETRISARYVPQFLSDGDGQRTGVTHGAGDEEYFLKTGDVVRVPVVVPTLGCPDASGNRLPLAPGTYTLTAGVGLLHAHRQQGLVAAPITVTITA